MRTEYAILDSLLLLTILYIIWLIFQQWSWSRSFNQPQTKKTKTPQPLKPKTENDCPQCSAKKTSPPPEAQVRSTPRPWSEVKSRRGRKKTIPTQGHACNNRKCAYHQIMDAAVHALVGYGSHGKQEQIQDLICQACGKKFTVRRDTVLYRLKTHSEKVALALALLAEGMDISALERVTGIGEGTLRTWLTRSGKHAEKLHGVFFQELIFAHIQLDELWANVRQASQEVWLWVATEASTKVIPVIRLGPRTMDMAMGVVHALCRTMPLGTTPAFTTDGLKVYFYALTAHFGQWVTPEGASKPLWQVSADLLYAQVKKILRRRRLVKVEHRMLGGELANLKARLQAIGFSGQINTAFVERLNLTIRQSISFLVRRTWGTAQFSPELEVHLHWWRGYYHYSRYHESLRVTLASPIQRKAKQLPQRYRSRTPAMAAGLTSHRWSVLQLISYPLP